MKLTRCWRFVALGVLINWQVMAAQSGQNPVVVSADEVQWGDLNPLRRDKSPAAANLWGDRSQDKATGMLVRFRKGFSSPPHIHNISYRGVVLAGAMHNDDPHAETMWMPAMSFWTQPAGENHITAANAEDNLIYLEIEAGPYLVKPSSEGFDNGERPVNLHRDNLVWQALPEHEDAEIAYLWGDTQPGRLRGALLRLPAGFNGALQSDSGTLRAVVVSGGLTYLMPDGGLEKALTMGGYFASEAEFTHPVKVDPQEPLVLYLRSRAGVSLATTD